MAHIIAENITNGAGVLLGQALDNRVNSRKGYKFYTGSLTVGNSPLVLDILTDLGDWGTGLVAVCITTSGQFNLQLECKDPNNALYNTGDQINILNAYPMNFDSRVSAFSKITLTRVSADSSYYILVF